MITWRKIGVVVSALWLLGLPVFVMLDSNRRANEFYAWCRSAESRYAAEMTPEQQLEWCSRAGQHDYAQLAPLVFECAETDAAAEALLRETAHEIEDMALALDPELQLPIVLLGSIGQRMAERLPAALRARLVEPAGDAVDGAHRLVRLQLKEAVA